MLEQQELLQRDVHLGKHLKTNICASVLNKAWYSVNS